MGLFVLSDLDEALPDEVGKASCDEVFITELGEGLGVESILQVL